MQSFKKVIYFLIVFIFFSCNKKESKSAEIAFETFYLKDSKNKDFENLENVIFKKLNSDKLGVKNGWYWFKIALKEKPNQPEIVFNINGNTIDAISFYDHKKRIVDIDRITLASQTYKIPNTSRTYFAKVHFAKQVHFPLKIKTPASYYKENNRLVFINGLFYGFVVIVFIINLIFYITLKDISFLTYALFLGLTNIAITDFDGLMALYTTPEMRYWVSTLLHFLVPISTAVFTSTLLGHHKLNPESIKIAGVLIVISALCYAGFITTDDFMYSAIGDAVGLAIVTYYMFLGVLELNKQKFAKFTVFGYSLIWISAILYMMPLNWGFSQPSVTLQTVKTGSILEMLVLTFAIVYRVKLLHVENKQFTLAIKNYIQEVFNLENQLQKNNPDTKIAVSIYEKVKEIADLHRLTVRETDLLLQIVKGLTNKEISEKLFISTNTVKYHTRNIYEKLDVKKRTEIASKIISIS